MEYLMEHIKVDVKEIKQLMESRVQMECQIG